MEHVALRSRDIAIVGYDSESGTLEIAFRRGGVYRYSEVPEGVYTDLMMAPSHGIFFERKIRGFFPYTKIR